MDREDVWWEAEKTTIFQIVQTPQCRWAEQIRDLVVRIMKNYDPRVDRLRVKQLVKAAYGQLVAHLGRELTPSHDSTLDDVERFVWHCPCSRCDASRRLHNTGARLRAGWGRHCELAALAATNGWINDRELVNARRQYAVHLDVVLGTTSGDVADADFAIHARHVATGHFVGNDNAGKDAIDMYPPAEVLIG